MLEGKAISETDMLQAMPQHILQPTAKAPNAFDITDAIEIARYIKMVGTCHQMHVTVVANLMANVASFSCMHPPVAPSLLLLQEFDQAYGPGPGWQCIVGTDFGSFVTHCNGFYFCSFAIMLFKGTALSPQADTSPFPTMETPEA